MLSTNYNYLKMAKKFEEQFDINVIAILDKSDYSAKKEGEINIVYCKKIKDYIERGSERPKRYKSGDLHVNLVDILDISITVVKDSEKGMEFLNGNIVYVINSEILSQEEKVFDLLKKISTRYVDSKQISLMYLMNPISSKNSVVNVYNDVMRLCFANNIIVNKVFPRSILSSLPAPVVNKRDVKGSLHNEHFKEFVNNLVSFVIKGEYRITDTYDVPDTISEYIENERLYLINLAENMEDRKFTYKELEEARNIAYSIIEQVTAIKLMTKDEENKENE